jgi:hypothetical protein
MTTPVPQGRTSCATASLASSVAAPQAIRQSGNLHALPSTSGLDTADPAPRAGDTPSHRHGRTRPENALTLRDLTRQAPSLVDCETCGRELTPCPVRGCPTVERRA